jgi:flavodoxin
MKKYLNLWPIVCLFSGPLLGQPLNKPRINPGDTLASRQPKILVAYYSRTGTTRTVARALASRLGGDIEEIVDTKNRQGIFGWLGAGRDASKKSKTVIAPIQKNPADYDLVILGTPVWAWNMTPAIRTYIIQNREKFRQVAFFCTMGKNGDVKTFSGMAELCGKKPLAAMALRTEEVKINQYHSAVNKFLAGLGMNETR